MDHMRFIIEDAIFPEMTNACQRNNVDFTIIDKKSGDTPTAQRTDIVCASICVANQFKINKTPAQVWLDIHCNEYYPKINSLHLLNWRYIILPYGELIRQKNSIFIYMETDKVFIRPNSGFKQFTGYTVPSRSWDHEIKSLIMFPEEYVLIAPERDIKREWRLVIGNRPENTPYVITGSQYIEDGQIIENPDDKLPIEVKEFAEHIMEYANLYSNYPAFIMDICESDNELQVLELNSFTSAGLYGCNLDLVVSHIPKLLEEFL